MKKGWVLGFLIMVAAGLCFAAARTIQVDPFFHYHAPDTSRWFYPLNNQRSQNDGVIRHFEYSGLITGTSMSENFRASEAEKLFGGDFIKVCSEGATFRELGAMMSTAAEMNPALQVVICGLDPDRFFDEKDSWRTDLGDYPWYLYDQDPLNDVEYIFNRDVLFSRIYPMRKEGGRPGFQGGITSFNDYSNWMGEGYIFGWQSIYPEGLEVKEPVESTPLMPEEAETIRDNVRQNLAAVAEAHPQVTFYYFITPYSAAWWQAWRAAGALEKKVAAERIVIEELLRCGNIRLFSFNCRFDITTDLNNYKDMIHYGDWINSLILQALRAEEGLLTRENYDDYLAEERRFYEDFDYMKLVGRNDSMVSRTAFSEVPAAPFLTAASLR